jgi:hypothetical protein
MAGDSAGTREAMAREGAGDGAQVRVRLRSAAVLRTRSVIDAVVLGFISRMSVIAA